MVPGKNFRTVALWQLYLAFMPVLGVSLGGVSGQQDRTQMDRKPWLPSLVDAILG